MFSAVRAAHRLGLAVAVVAACIALGAPNAGADADPASDALLIQDIFFPYQPAVSAGLTNALNQVVAEAKAAHFPVKVALIASPDDLGGLPNLFAQPQRYADFLDREISFNAPVALLVVMPQGFGTHSLGKQGELNPLLPVNPAPGSDGLAKAAIAAVEKLAADAGHPLAAPKIVAAPAGKSGGGVSPALTFGAPVLLVLIAAAAVALTRRREDEDEDEEEEGEDA